MKKTISVSASFCLLAMLLSGCSSNDTSDLNKIIGELSTSYLEGQGPSAVSTEATTPAPFTNAVCGTISGLFGGTFMITDETGTTYNVSAVSALIYGADELADGMTAVVSFTDTSSKSKSITAISVTVISGQAEATEETVPVSDEITEPEETSETSAPDETSEGETAIDDALEASDNSTSDINS